MKTDCEGYDLCCKSILNMCIDLGAAITNGENPTQRQLMLMQSVCGGCERCGNYRPKPQEHAAIIADGDTYKTIKDAIEADGRFVRIK